MLSTAIKPYLHPKYKVPSNILSESENFNCDNYHLFSAHYHILMRLSGHSLSTDDALNYFYFYHCCSGLVLDRFPGRKDDISQDELIGANVLHYIYGRSTRNNPYGCYNLKNPSKFDIRYWFARHLDFAPLIKASNKIELSFFDQISWAAAVILTANDREMETSGKLLRFVQFPVIAGKYSICDMAIKYFLNKVSLKNAYRIFFGDNHPFYTYCPNRIGLDELTAKF